jgi:DNA repair photolyase
LYCDLCKTTFTKKDILAEGKTAVLKELKKHKGAYFSGVSDCFLPKNIDLTIELLEMAWKNKKDFVPLVITKQIIPDKAIKLFAKNKDRLVLQYSIPCLNNRILSLIEPGAASTSNRLKTLKKLTKAGIPVIAVAMPWLNIYENESIEDLPKTLAKVGIKRIIIGTGSLTKEQKQKMIATKDKTIVNAMKPLTQYKQVTTRVGYIWPLKKRIKEYSKITKAFEKYGIKPKICTANNQDLIGKVKFPLCTSFKHRNFKNKKAK